MGSAVPMRRWIRLSILLGACLCTGAGADVDAPTPDAPSRTAPAPLVLGPGVDTLQLASQPQAVEPRGSVSIAAAAAGRLKTRPGAEGAVLPLSSDNELWMPLRVRNPARQPVAWQLQVPPPALDEVTLFEMQDGRWVEWASGDHVPQSAWPKQGRFVRFALQLEPGETRSLFLRVRSNIPTPVLARLVAQDQAEIIEQRAAIGMGLVLGTLALLVAACFVQAAVYRDAAYFLYGAYALLLGLAFASISGLASQHLWGDLPAWSDASKAVFPLAAAGVSVWLVRALCRLPTRGRNSARVSAALGAMVLFIAVLVAVMRTTSPWLMAVGMSTAALSVVAMAISTWRRGDSMGGWVLAAHAPLIGVTLLVLLRMFGVAPFEFDSSVLMSGAIAAILPLLLVAVYQRSREFLAVVDRARGMASIDPLTGLLAAGLFGDRVRAAVRRYERSRHDAVVMYVRVSNYSLIRKLHGNEVAEQSMIRAAIKLQRLMPDADCTGRVNENTIGLIVETITARAPLMDRATRLVAHGLMPLPGLKPEVMLNFHVVAAVLSENPLAAPALQAALESLLGSVSARTRRPIRFLEPGASSAPAEADIEGEDEASAMPA